jgi:hypothetical protein
VSAVESLAEAVGTESRLTALKALRDRLATTMDESESARDIAALSKQLMDVLIQIEAVAPKKVEVKSAVDQIAERRAQRGARAARVSRSSGG